MDRILVSINGRYRRFSYGFFGTRFMIQISVKLRQAVYHHRYGVEQLRHCDCTNIFFNYDYKRKLLIRNSVADPDPGSGAFLPPDPGSDAFLPPDPGSRSGMEQCCGSGIKHPGSATLIRKNSLGDSFRLTWCRGVAVPHSAPRPAGRAARSCWSHTS
jgi:hypothetical protein